MSPPKGVFKIKPKALTINDRKHQKLKKRINKVCFILFVISIFISFAFTSVSAASNSWNLCTSQIDVSYFYIGGSSLNHNWNQATINTWVASNNLSSRFNQYVICTDNKSNAIYKLEYIYNHNGSSVAVEYGTRWNNLRSDIQQLVFDTQRTCPLNDQNKSTNLKNQISASNNNLTELINDIDSAYALAELNKTNIFEQLSNPAALSVNTLWKTLGVEIQGYSGRYNNQALPIITSTDIENIVNRIAPIVKTFAYALACILFGINVTTTALQYELLTVRGGVKIFARVIFVKIWIDLAIPICLYIFNLINYLANSIMNTFAFSAAQVMPVENIDFQTSNSWLDGIFNILKWFANFFINIIMLLPRGIIAVILFVCIIKVFVKLISRLFEVTCLTAVSPIFFSALVGDTTVRYFRKFISAFLSTTAYILFMGITYAVATQWIASCSATITVHGSAIFKEFLMYLPKTFIVIAACRVMSKPPKVLTSLFDGG